MIGRDLIRPIFDHVQPKTLISLYRYSDFRSSRPEEFYKKGILRSFIKFTGKHLCHSLFFNKVAGLRPSTLLKKRLWHRCFSVNFVKFLGTLFLQNTSGGCFCDFTSVCKYLGYSIQTLRYCSFKIAAI